MVTAIGNLRLNLGCGDYPLEDFVNVDAIASRAVDAVLTVPPLPWPDETVVEIYMGHFLEHLDDVLGPLLLAECYRVLRPGGTIGIVVPDFFEAARRYVQNEYAPFEWPAGTWHDLRDLDSFCHFVIFSTCQTSRHHWAFDLRSLRRAMEAAGFEILEEIDRMNDPRLSTPQWYQCGWQARKP